MTDLIPETPPRQVCRGSILLGTACRHCDRCKADIARHQAQGVRWPLLALKPKPDPRFDVT